MVRLRQYSSVRNLVRTEVIAGTLVLAHADLDRSGGACLTLAHMEIADDCLFCKIISRTVPSVMVYEDDEVVAFRDIAPVAPVHVLIVPRRHIVDAGTLEREDQSVLIAMFLASKSIAYEEGIGANGYRLTFNVGEDAGNSVAHLHLHLLGGRFLAWPPG